MSDRSDPDPPANDGPCTTTTFPYLDSLNAAQHSAVIAPPSTPLQILAGPGSGKTRVLTSRVAYLVQRHGYKPYEIVAVTFTNKSANEMRKRLRVLLGEQQADNLVLGGCTCRLDCSWTRSPSATEEEQSSLQGRSTRCARGTCGVMDGISRYRAHSPLRTPMMREYRARTYSACFYLPAMILTPAARRPCRG